MQVITKKGILVITRNLNDRTRVIKLVDNNEDIGETRIVMDKVKRVPEYGKEDIEGAA